MPRTASRMRPRARSVVAVADAHVVLEPAVLEGRIHHDGIREQLGVGDHDAPAIVGADERRAGLNVLDRAFIILATI